MESKDLMPAEDLQQTPMGPIGPEQLLKWLRILERYKSGRQKTTERILASERWWKMRNAMEASAETQVGKDGGFVSQSGWLHNVLASKHADAMDAFPKACFLPREESDKEEAHRLEQIFPCILEQNGFEEVYSDVMWQKCKTGTGVYKIIWDSSKHNGLGDIGIMQANLLNLYWQPEIKDIQKSRYFFQTELRDKDLVEEEYPWTKDKLKGKSFVQSKFLSDEHQDESGMVTVVEVYYHKNMGGKKILHYCKFVEDLVLYATENERQAELDEMGNVVADPMAATGLYDHGLYPFVFDPLFPVEGSPCGYGYVDLCRNPQIAIDLLKTSFVKNAAVGSTPRYFSRLDGNIKEDELLDLSNPIVHVSGNVDDASLRPIDYNPLPGNYISLMQDIVNELRETSGNTETAAGTGTPSGVTAAAAIAALQQASGKGSRDSGRGSYRAFCKLITMGCELIRQFFDLPRTFRITNEMGNEQFISYTNQKLKPQRQFMGDERVPYFDISIVAEKKNAYTSMAQNELALQFFQLGFFNPQMADQAIMCIEMMDFDSKDQVLSKIRKNSQTMDMLVKYMQFALHTATDPGMQQAILMDMQNVMGIAAPAPTAPIPAPQQTANPAGMPAEHPSAAKAREQSAEAAMP